MKKIILTLNLLACAANAQNENLSEKKYIFDVGSGGIYVAGFEVNKHEKKVVNRLGHYYANFPLQKCISKSHDHKTITNKCIDKANSILKAIFSHMKMDCKKDKCEGIATAWARNSTNASEILEKFAQHNINIKVVSQYDEGAIAFKNIFDHQKDTLKDPLKMIVFDIGGGSFQISDQTEDNQIKVFHGDYGMFNLKALLEKKFGNSKTGFIPEYNIENVKKFVLDLISNDLKQDTRLIEKLKHKDLSIFGVGSFFFKGLRKQLELGNDISLEKIESTLDKVFNKSAEEVHKLYPNMPIQYCSGVQHSLLLVYSVLKNITTENVKIVKESSCNKFLAVNGIN